VVVFCFFGVGFFFFFFFFFFWGGVLVFLFVFFFFFVGFGELLVNSTFPLSDCEDPAPAQPFEWKLPSEFFPRCETGLPPLFSPRPMEEMKNSSRFVAAEKHF